jgi:hypothetical protein
MLNYLLFGVAQVAKTSGMQFLVSFSPIFNPISDLPNVARLAINRTGDLNVFISAYTCPFSYREISLSSHR